MDLITLLEGDLTSAFRRGAEPIPALQFSYYANLRWCVGADDTLTLTMGTAVTTLDLHAYTHTTLATKIASLGCNIIFQNQDIASWTAATLVAGEGFIATPSDEWVTLYAFTNLLWVVLRPLARELELARNSGVAFQGQLILPDARLHWADFWGSYFGVVRRQNELDGHYTQRIIDEVRRARNTEIAIERGVYDSLESTIDIFEPWKRMWILSKSRLSGRHHFPGHYYQYHVIHPLSSEYVDWPAVLAEIERLRPSGTLVWSPNNILPPQDVNAGFSFTFEERHAHLHQKNVWVSGGHLSANLILSGNYVLFLTTGKSTHYQLRYNINVFLPSGDPTWNELTWGTDTWTEHSQYARTAMLEAKHTTET